MKSNLFAICQENFETTRNYYEIINQRVKNYYDYIIKYIDCTNKYCKKLKSIYEQNKSIANSNNNENEIFENIEIDCTLFNGKEQNKFKKKINITLIEKSMEKMGKFFQKFSESLEEFANNLNNPLKELNQLIEVTDNEISSIRNSHSDQKKIFLLNYSNFSSLNNELKKQYTSAEDKLIDYCKNEKVNIESSNSNLNSVLSDYVKNQNEIFKKYKSLDNFGKIFYDSTNQKISIMKGYISSLYENFQIFSKKIFDSFQNSFISPMNELVGNKNDIGNDKKNNEDFENLLNSNIKNLDENFLKINLDEYRIKSISQMDLQYEEMNFGKLLINTLPKNFSFEVIKNPDNNNLKEEEIYFIVKNMYDKFDLIKKEYILEIEYKKMELKKIIDKLFSFCYRDKNSNTNENDNWVFLEDECNEEGENEIKEEKIEKDNKNKNEIIISEDEFNYLCQAMSNKIYSKLFLSKVNQYRTFGIFEMTQEIFNYTAKIFKEISKYIYIIQNINDKKELIIDFVSTRLLIILSQTYYIVDNQKKIYLQNELKDEKVFHISEFWIQIVQNGIEEEMEKLEKSVADEKMEEIAYAQILSFLTGMIKFELEKQEMQTITEFFFDKYKMSQNNKNNILNLINKENKI